MHLDNIMDPVELPKIWIKGGKHYSWGNSISIHKHSISIEFNSDYTLWYDLTAKNKKKQAMKMINKIPKEVDLNWFHKNGWEIPKELMRYVNE